METYVCDNSAVSREGSRLTSLCGFRARSLERVAEPRPQSHLERVAFPSMEHHRPLSRKLDVDAKPFIVSARPRQQLSEVVAVGDQIDCIPVNDRLIALGLHHIYGAEQWQER